MQFAEQLRRDLRNPLMHAHEGMREERSAYREWCDKAYATATRDQWMDVGLHPDLHNTNSVGWISLVAAAARPVPQASTSVQSLSA